MTAVKVVDASAAAAMLYGEPEAQFVIDKVGAAKRVAPDLLAYELANVCWTKSRREPERRDSYLQAFELRGELGVEQRGIDFDAAIDLAIEASLTIYDASYLWLAEHLGAELVTLDRRLDAAAKARAR